MKNLMRMVNCLKLKTFEDFRLGHRDGENNVVPQVVPGARFSIIRKDGSLDESYYKFNMIIGNFILDGVALKFQP